MDWPSFIVNLVCLAALLLQLIFVVIDQLVNPTLTNTRVREDSVKELPLLFKICPTPGFQHRALQAAGYQGVKSYFTGLVKIENRIALGWTGNSTELKSKSTTVMREFLGSITHSVEDIVESVSLVTMDNEQIEIELDMIRMRRVNYPSNCFTLHFLTNSHHLNKSGVKSLKINFQKQDNISTEVQVTDRNMFTERNLNSHSFFASGDRIHTSAGLLSSYFVSTAVEEDFTSNCTSYPNDNFANYSQCDNERYVRKRMSAVAPGLVPVWMVDYPDYLDNVTTHANRTFSGSSAPFDDLFIGNDLSDCLPPCSKLYIQTRLLTQQVPRDEITSLLLTFSPSSKITTTNFIKLTPITFLSEVGSSMGLWLGLGVAQLAQAFTVTANFLFGKKRMCPCQ